MAPPIGQVGAQGSSGSGGTGNVTGPASAVSGHLAVFSGTTGKIIADGGAVPSGGITGTLTVGKVPVASGASTVVDGPITVTGANIDIDSGGVTTIGDVNALSNNTKLVVDATANTAFLNAQSGISAMGDALGFGNGNEIEVNDNLGKISLASADVRLANVSYFSLAALATDSTGKIVVAASSAKLKENIAPYTNGLNDLLKVNAVSFNWREDSGRNDGKQHLGVIAENLQEGNPLFASEVAGGLLQPEQLALIGALIESVKTLHARVETLEAQLKHTHH